MGVHICKRDGFIIQMGLSFKVWGILSCERIYKLSDHRIFITGQLIPNRKVINKRMFVFF